MQTKTPAAGRPAFGRALALALTLLLVLLSACGEEDPRSIIMAAPPQDLVPIPQDSSLAEDAAEETREDESMALSVASRNLSGRYAGSEAGCYNLYTYEDGSADIYYMDYAALQMRFLDAMYAEGGPTKGFFVSVPGGATPVVAGDFLFVLRQRAGELVAQGAGKDARAALSRYNADGTGGETTVLDEKYAFHLPSASLWDGEALYFMLTEDTEAGARYLLACLHTGSMEVEELVRFDEGYEYTLEGFWEKGPLITAATLLPAVDAPAFTEAWENRQFTLYRYGMYSGEATELKHWAQNQPVYVYNNLFYYWLDDAKCLYALNADTGEEWAAAEGFAPDKYTFASMMPAWDASVRIQFSADDGRTLRTFNISTETGKVSEPPTDNLGTNINLFAETADYFLVSHSEKWIRRELVDPTYDPALDTRQTYDTKFKLMTEYALISKADHWAGRKNFIELEDMIYGKGSRNTGSYGNDTSTDTSAEAEAPPAEE